MSCIILSCSISKRISPSDAQDLALNENLFLIWARRVEVDPRAPMLTTHAIPGETGVRGVSAARFNPSTARSVVGGSVFDNIHRPNLIRAHGILMIIAWPLLGLIGIFFPLYMKTVLPNGEWFQVLLYNINTDMYYRVMMILYTGS